MISNPCTRRDIGASAGSVPPSAHPSLICGVSEDVIQVSITSGSPSRPEPQDSQADKGGLTFLRVARMGTHKIDPHTYVKNAVRFFVAKIRPPHTPRLSPL